MIKKLFITVFLVICFISNAFAEESIANIIMKFDAQLGLTSELGQDYTQEVTILELQAVDQIISYVNNKEKEEIIQELENEKLIYFIIFKGYPLITETILNLRSQVSKKEFASEKIMRVLYYSPIQNGFMCEKKF
jgi:hypothetical protein